MSMPIVFMKTEIGCTMISIKMFSICHFFFLFIFNFEIYRFTLICRFVPYTRTVTLLNLLHLFCFGFEVFVFFVLFFRAAFNNHLLLSCARPFRLKIFLLHIFLLFLVSNILFSWINISWRFVTVSGGQNY